MDWPLSGWGYGTIPSSCTNQCSFSYILPKLHSDAGPLHSLWTVGHVSPHVWKSMEATVEDAMQDDVGDEVAICALCCQKCTTRVCGE